jgi:hypothetical protein
VEGVSCPSVEIAGHGWMKKTAIVAAAAMLKGR